MMQEESQFDEPLEDSLDRLGRLMAPDPAAESDFVSQVMERIEAAPPSVRRPSPSRRRILTMVIGAAACVVVALASWRTMAVRHAGQEIVVNHNVGEENVSPLPSAAPSKNLASDAEPATRTSTWSVVTESVVLEGDVPVRELVYREFERVEVLDAKGNAKSDLVVPTKVMLLASDEPY